MTVHTAGTQNGHVSETFCINNTSGIFPRSSYLKVVGDFTRWHDRIVFGCDDTAQKDFLNKRKIKGNIGGPGQSNSNLWFVSPERIDQLGPTNASGSVWMNDTVVAGQTSDPFLFNGWDNRCVWVRNDSKDKVCLRICKIKSDLSHFYLEPFSCLNNFLSCLLKIFFIF